MARKYKNPMTNPLQYASQQLHTGAPSSYGAAQRTLVGYDYVIVGAGAAGCVLASRLSEDEDASVLLLEAGGPHTGILEARVPILFPKLFHTKHDWDYNTVEQPGLVHRRLYWPRGKLLGGSTSINAMMYHHGTKSDFDEWAAEMGCKGWSYNELAPYFRCMERFTTNPRRPMIDMKHRGSSGKLRTGYAHLAPIVDKGFLPACEEVGIVPNSDINTPAGTVGVTRLQTFIDSKGRRSSMATAFLSPDTLRRRNLYIGCHAHVSRILFDCIDSHKVPTAIGVEFLMKRGGKRFEVHAKREVILSAGAINTPQLLMLSGIGPADELTRLGISVVKSNTAVGQNLKDHLCATGVILKAKPKATLDYLNNKSKAIPSLLRWFVAGDGPLTSNAAEAAAFVRSADHKFPSTEPRKYPKDYSSGGVGPDIEILAAPLAFIHHGEEKGPPGVGVFSLGACSLRPQSQGSVKVNSTNPFDHPTIDPKYLSDKDNNDEKVMISALRLSIKIAHSQHFKEFLEPVPGNDDPSSYWWPYSSTDIDAITDEQLSNFMKEKAFTLYHPVGTARMGPIEWGNSVVDTDCRVHGVNRLRVVDASVFPEQISGHPTAAIGAIAYRMSEIIQETPVALRK